MEENVNKKVQPKLAMFFKKPSELKPSDLQVATVQAVKSKHRRIERTEAVEHDREDGGDQQPEKELPEGS